MTFSGTIYNDDRTIEQQGVRKQHDAFFTGIFKNIISFFNFTNDILGTIYNDDGMIEQQGVLRK